MARNWFAEALDSQDVVNDGDTAVTIAGILGDLNINIKGPMLGLAAGEAVAELDLAKRLVISKVILVDKSYNSDRDNKDGIVWVSETLEKYLASDDEKFGLITVIGAEYAVETPDKWPLIWQNLTYRTDKGSIVVVCPHNNKYQIPSDLPYEVLFNDQILIVRRLAVVG